MAIFCGERFSMRAMLLVLVALVGVCIFTACSDSAADDDIGESGFRIVGTATDGEGAASISCNGRAQTLSLVFKVRAAYTITTDGADWLRVLVGESGEAGDSRSLKLKVSENMTGEVRTAMIYIDVEGRRSRLATVEQSESTVDAIVAWMDERLEGEYLWLDAYKRLKDKGNIDYTKTGSNFLTAALTGMGDVNKDDGYVDADGKRRLFSYIREYSATRAVEDAVPVTSYGFSLCYTVLASQSSSNYSFLIEHVYPGSPAEVAGFRRGDVIRQVNGSYIDNSNYTSLFKKLQSGSGETITVGKRVSVIDGDEVISTHDVVAGEYYESPVACSMILREAPDAGFDFGDRKIGYVSYMSFDSDFDDELIEAMQYMSREGVTDLIIDLRDNGGGSVYSSVYFGSMLVSADAVGKNMVTLRRHPSNTIGSSSIPFHDEVYLTNEEPVALPHLDMKRVYFITSDGSASASELLIMAMRAQGVEAVTVGKQSLGKDCGMDVQTVKYGATYYEFAPITFRNEFDGYNVSFADGIPADIDFDILKYETTDEDVADALDWYPLPTIGAAWGDYLSDIALGETVANILGSTLIPTADQQALLRREAQPVTRAAESVRRVEMPRPAKQGMFLRENERERLTKVE